MSEPEWVDEWALADEYGLMHWMVTTDINDLRPRGYEKVMHRMVRFEATEWKEVERESTDSQQS